MYIHYINLRDFSRSINRTFTKKVHLIYSGYQEEILSLYRKKQQLLLRGELRNEEMKNILIFSWFDLFKYLFVTFLLLLWCPSTNAPVLKKHWEIHVYNIYCMW